MTQYSDDRPEYASIQAILYGPYLVAGLTSGDWSVKSESSSSPLDWITPIPSGYANHLVSFSQGSDEEAVVITNSNKSISIEKFPKTGTDAAIHATFRLILNDSSELKTLTDAIGKWVMLEPFDLPGRVLVDQGKEEDLAVASADDTDAAFFHLVPGLDKKDGTVSLQSTSNEGCFVFSGGNHESGASMKVSCSSGSADVKFNQGTSFIMNKGLSEYHPISFVAKGAKQNFLLMPLFSLRDESYTVYFKIGA